MNQVFYWNSVLLEASRRDHSQGYANGQHPGPTATSRAMAIVHLAIHDAVAFVSNRPAASYLKKKFNVSIAKPAGVRLEDVIDGAAHTALVALYPRYEDYFDDARGTFVQAGFDYGRDIALALLEKRKNDGAAVAASAPEPMDMPRAHAVDPYHPDQGRLGPAWGNVALFVGPQIALAEYPGKTPGNAAAEQHYQLDYVEARDVGARNSATRTPEQALIGVFWGYDGAQGIGVPPRLYNQLARKLRPDATIVQAAEMLAIVNVAMADAGIDAWRHKYDFNLWRPVVGVRRTAAPDGDAFWAPLGAPQTNRRGALPATPPFPAYPSGHATFGAALFQVLQMSRPGGSVMTTQQVLDAADDTLPDTALEAFDFVSDECDGRALDSDGSVRERSPRHFPSYARAVFENAISRVYLGVHWRFDGLPRDAADNIGGVPLGLAVGRQVHTYFNDGASLTN
jgi:hypothetical protein